MIKYYEGCEGSSEGRLKEAQSLPNSFSNETTQASHELFGTGGSEIGHIASGDGIFHGCRGLHRILGVALIVFHEIAARTDKSVIGRCLNIIGETRVILHFPESGNNFIASAKWKTLAKGVHLRFVT